MSEPPPTTTPRARGRLRALATSPAARQLAIVAAVSLTLRLWTLAEQRAGNPLFQTAMLDDEVYVRAAQDFLNGAPPQPWFLAPLYPTLLGLLGKLTGATTVTMAAACGLSAACGVITSALLAATARMLAGARAGWAAGLLHAAAGAFVFQDLIPGQEAVLALLYVLAILVALCWYRTRSWWAAAAFGAVVGVAALGRGTALLLLPAALPLVLATAPDTVAAELRTRGRAWLAVVVAAAGVVAVLLPAAIRNAGVAGDFSPLTWSFGPNLYAANSPEARATGTYHSGDLGASPAEMERNARRIAERRLGRALRPTEVSAYWRGRTLDEIGTAGEMAAHAGRKFLLLFADHPFGSSHALRAESRFSRWLRIVPAGEWWLLALGLLGWWITRPGRPIADVIALAGALHAAALLVVFPANRYRLAVLVTFALLAGTGIALFRHAAPRRRAVAVALAVLVGVLALLPGWLGLFPYRLADSRANVGRLLLERGRAREAVEVLREADREEPGSVDVLAPLAAALDAVGARDEAARAAARHNAIIDTLPAGRVRIVLDLAEAGRRDPAALEAAERLGRDLAPTLLNDDLRARLWANLALVAALRGDRPAAVTRMARARDLAPELAHLRDIETRLPR